MMATTETKCGKTCILHSAHRRDLFFTCVGVGIGIVVASAPAVYVGSTVRHNAALITKAVAGINEVKEQTAQSVRLEAALRCAEIRLDEMDKQVTQLRGSVAAASSSQPTKRD